MSGYVCNSCGSETDGMYFQMGSQTKWAICSEGCKLRLMRMFGGSEQ